MYALRKKKVLFNRHIFLSTFNYNIKGWKKYEYLVIWLFLFYYRNNNTMYIEIVNYLKIKEEKN